METSSKDQLEKEFGRFIIHTETEHYIVGICKQLNSTYDWSLLLVVKQLDGNGWVVVVPVLMPAFGTVSPMDYVRIVADYYERHRVSEKVEDNFLYLSPKDVETTTPRLNVVDGVGKITHSLESLTEAAYEAYRDARLHFDIEGWEDLTGEVRGAWYEAVLAVMRRMVNSIEAESKDDLSL